MPPSLTPTFRSQPGNLIRFRQEAQRVWEEQEAQWEKEREARERLMREVDRFELPVKRSVSSEEFNSSSLFLLWKGACGKTAAAGHEDREEP